MSVLAAFLHARRLVPSTRSTQKDTMTETDDEFWARLLGDDDPCAPGKDWAAAAFGPPDDAHTTDQKDTP